MPQDPILRSFERLVSHDPLAPLVVSPGRRATVGDVDALARVAGSRLAERPLPPGTAVGLVAANGPGMLASLVALARAGLAAVLMDGQTPEAESLRTAAALGAPAVLRCRTGWPQGPDDWSLSAPLSNKEGDPLCLPGIAVVKLTSGSTGAPRGIAASAEALVADDAALAASMGLKAEDRLLTTIPMSHSYGLSSLVLPALVRGSLLVLPEESTLYDPFFAAERGGATVFPAVPAYLDALLRLSDAGPRPPSLRLVLTAGAPLRAETSQRFREVFGLPVHVFYGASECGGICYDREGGAAERGTVGAPVEGVRVTLEPLATDGNDREMEEGAEGVVTVESPAVSQGYLPDGDPRLGDGRFTAGDLGAWRDGELALRGRLDDVVNVKGKKVNPREVEAVIAQLGGVEEVAVLGMPAPGGGGEMLRSVIACRSGGLTAQEVLGWCRSRLAPHKVPRSVVLVPELPRTSRGKLDRSALRALERKA